MVKLMIDPGHGGKDSGCVYGKLKEKDITLIVAKRVKQLLEERYKGCLVYLTRNEDQYLTLEQRSSMANVIGVDAFISIHVNAGGGEGFESFVYTNVDTKTKELQKCIHESIIKESVFKDRKMKKANFSVLRKTQMPAVLTEIGFIDNRNDRMTLEDKNELNLIAHGHVKGIVKYFNLLRK